MPRVVPVTHYASGPLAKDDMTHPNSHMRRREDFVRWLYLDDRSNASELYFDLGRTATFREHLDATRSLTPSLCTHGVKERCRWLYNDTVVEARRRGLDSIQFTGHTMDRNNRRRVPLFEVVDLRVPRRPLGVPWPHYFADANATRPCVAVRSAQRVSCQTVARADALRVAPKKRGSVVR